MKPTFLSLFLLACLVPLPAMAQSASPTAGPPLPEWDALSAAQRDILVAPLRDRWNGEPGERTRMLHRAQRWQSMSPEQRQRARHGMHRWEGMPPEERLQARALFHAMRGMDEAQRKAFLAQWRQMTQQQRAEWVEMHPAPQRPRPASPQRARQE